MSRVSSHCGLPAVKSSGTFQPPCSRQTTFRPLPGQFQGRHSAGCSGADDKDIGLVVGFSGVHQSYSRSDGCCAINDACVTLRSARRNPHKAVNPPCAYAQTLAPNMCTTSVAARWADRQPDAHDHTRHRRPRLRRSSPRGSTAGRRRARHHVQPRLLRRPSRRRSRRARRAVRHPAPDRDPARTTWTASSTPRAEPPGLSIELPVTTFAANADGTLAVYEAARMTGVRRIVFFSSECALGNITEPGPVTEDVKPARHHRVRRDQGGRRTAWRARTTRCTAWRSCRSASPRCTGRACGCPACSAT